MNPNKAEAVSCVQRSSSSNFQIRAQTHAILYLAEQQEALVEQMKIANIIALAGSKFKGLNDAPDATDALFKSGSHCLRPEIRDSLGI